MAVSNCYLNLVLLLLAAPFVAANPRIINGVDAISNNTRFQVSVRVKQPDTIFSSGHICSGALVAPKAVLSAAHCFCNDDEGAIYNEKNLYVVMGSLNLYDKTNNSVSFNVRHVEFHDLNRTTFKYDVALLFLDGTAPTDNPDVAVIPMNREEVPVGTMCQASGWGVTETGDDSATLKTVDLPVIDNETCSSNYGNEISLEGMICAGKLNGGINFCDGDDGGPLVCNGKLAGIFSFVNSCNNPGYPAVNTNVSYFAEWIDEMIKRNSASLSSLNTAVILSMVLVMGFLK